MSIQSDRIYILDRFKSRNVFVFDKEGKFIQKFENKGNGPGEFSEPYSFWIDRDQYMYILDNSLSKFIQCKLPDLEFVSELKLPALSPLSFAYYPENEWFIFYYYMQKKEPLAGQQYLIADKDGNIIRKFFDAPASSKLSLGNAANTYLFDGKARTYPYFSNKVYELTNDSLKCCYTFAWGILLFHQRVSLKERRIHWNFTKNY